MLAHEHADNVTLARGDFEIAAYDGKAGTIEGGPQPDWPDFAREGGATARIPVVGPDGQTRYIYTKQTDVAAGPGPSRKLSEYVLDP